MLLKIRYLTAALAALSAIQIAYAGPIYKWVDEQGVTHYSSVPVKGAKAADLPPIMRGERKIPESQLFTCREHSGIDCESGADVDGSVVCRDGFRDSTQRFSFLCSAPKLQIADISPVSSDGGFSVMVRNGKSVPSQQTKISVKFPDGTLHALEGPDQVEGFGLGEFIYTPPPEERERIRKNPASSTLSFRPEPQHVTITCANCP